MKRSAFGRALSAVFAFSILILLLVYLAPAGHTGEERVAEATDAPSAFIPFLRKDPTPTPGAIIRIVDIYLPPLLPKAYEYVEIENQGTGPQVMTGWRLKNEVGGEIYQFPEFTLEGSRAVRVYSRIGHDSDDELYWNHVEHHFPIWHRGDTACLYTQDWTKAHCYP